MGEKIPSSDPKSKVPKGEPTTKALATLLAATVATAPVGAQEKAPSQLVGNVAPKVEQVVQNPEIIKFDDAAIIASVDTEGMTPFETRAVLGKARGKMAAKIFDQIDAFMVSGEIEKANLQYAELMRQTENPDSNIALSYANRAIQQILIPLNEIDKKVGVREDSISEQDLKELSASLVMDMSMGFSDPKRFPSKDFRDKNMNLIKKELERWKFPDLDQYDFDNMTQESFNKLMFQVGNGTYELLRDAPDRRRTIAGVLTYIVNRYSDGLDDKDKSVVNK